MPALSLAERAGGLRDRPLPGYVFGVLATLLALGLRLLVSAWFQAVAPFIFFMPALLLTAFIAGRGPALLTAALSLLAAWYFFLPPFFSFALPGATAMPLVAYAIVSAIIILLIDTMQKAIDRLGAERQVTARLHDQQRVLFAELQHRVANNLAFVSGLLRLQRRRIETDPASALAVIDEAATRIDMMGLIHRQLYDPATANGAYPGVIKQICEELARASGTAGIEFRVDLPSDSFDIDKLMPLSLLVTEAVTNALKHGFAGRASGVIEIRLVDEPEQRVVTVRDTGIGVGETARPASGAGMGTRIMQGLAAQLGGTISWANDNGTVVRLTLPK